MLFRSDRKSTRLTSSHTLISYAVFCLKKKTKTATTNHLRRPKNQSAHATRLIHRRVPGRSVCLSRLFLRLITFLIMFFFFFFKVRATPGFPSFSQTPVFRS